MTLMQGLDRAIASRGSESERWSPAASRTLILLSYGYALLPTAMVLGWAQAEGNFKNFGLWWDVYYRPNVAQWAKSGLATGRLMQCDLRLLSSQRVLPSLLTAGR